MVSRVMTSLACVIFFAVACAAPSGTCLEDAIPASARKEIGTASERYPLGVWVNNWPAGQAVATLMALLFEEAMGYVTELKGPGDGTVHGFFALTGCRDPTSEGDRGCDNVTCTLVHVNVEGWTIGYITVWEMLQREYPQMAPKNLGNAGYNGHAGTYVLSRVKETAYNAEGVSLEFYREYDITWKDPSRHFADLDEVNTSRLSPCSDTVLMDKAQMGGYANITGDHDGVTPEGDGVVGKCWSNHFWYSPACRQKHSRCVPLFTGGVGWSMVEQMQKATFFNMPFAVAVAKDWDNYVSVPQDFNSVFYWWVPDTTFLRMNPVPLVYPPYDRLAYEQGDLRSQGAAVSIDTHVSQDLHILAPDVEAVLTSYKLDIRDVEGMMRDKLDTKDSDRDVACRWLKANTQRWKQWLPDKTKCFGQFGLFDTVTERFLPDRTDATSAVSNIECRACPAGYFSEALQDDKGTTFICKMCAPGTSQASAGAMSCDPCPRGEYAGQHGSEACARCDSGTYQDEVGKSECLLCPEGTSTLGRGGLSVLDCGCLAGTINVVVLDNASLDNAPFRCESCGDGLECPFGSSVESLLRGEPGASAEAAPQVRIGYLSLVENPSSIFKCKPAHRCPGGKPGTCAGGLQGDFCDRCAMGEHGESCIPCQAHDFILWIFVGLIALILSSIAYSFVNVPSANNASALPLFLMSAGLVIHAIQSVAIFGMMNVKWPTSFMNTSERLQIVLLDINTSNVICFSGWTDWIRFAVSALAFPLLIVWLLLCWLLSRYLPKVRFVKPWKLSHTLNTLGTFLQAGFATICAIGFQPLMCYRHPNGARSLLKYPGTFCGSADQFTMLFVGFVLLLIGMVFAVSCIVASWSLPKWSLNKEIHYVQAFRFFTGKFRLSCYWFGLVPLMRGFGFSFIIVLGTDAPRVQTTCATVILVVYFALQIGCWPWKAKVVNIADLLINALLLLLINQSTQEVTLSEQRFAADATLVIMVLLLFCAVSLVFFNVFAALKELNIVNTGVPADGPSKFSQALKDTAERLMEVDIYELDGKVKRLNHCDLEVLEFAFTVVSADLQIGRARFKARMVSSALNERLSVAMRPVPDDGAPEDDAKVSPDESDGPAGLVDGQVLVDPVDLVDEEPSSTSNMQESDAALSARNLQELLDRGETTSTVEMVILREMVSTAL